MSTSPKIVLFWISIFIYATGMTQETRLGMLPSLNLNKALKNNWRINLKIEARNSLITEEVACSNGTNHGYIHTDYTFITSKRVGLNNALAAGVLFRYKEEQLTLRYLQQFILVKKYNTFRMAHRFAMDQTKSQSDPIKYRIRYRATLALPLNGTSIDPKEWYLKINNEYLNTFQTQKNELEFRLIPLVGYKFSEMNKLEYGLDFRRTAFLSERPKNSYWVSLKWFLII